MGKNHFFILAVIIIIVTVLAGCNDIISAGTSDTTPIRSSITQSTSNLITPSATANNPDYLTESIIKADLIVLSTVTESEEINPTHTDDVQYTLYTLTIETVIKGSIGINKVLMKILLTDAIQSVYTGYPELGDTILVGLNYEEDNVYIPSSGGFFSSVYWIKGSFNSGEALEEALGRLISIMLAYNIPVALPQDEIPPLPATTTFPH